MRGFLPFVLFALLAPEALPAQDGRAWLDEVAPLITAREREAFLGLGNEADRQAFIQRFWQVRDLYPDTPRNEARERWETRLQEARRRWRDPLDERARIYLVAGEPSAVFETRCAGAPLEVWTYEPRFQVKDRMVLFFLSGGEGGPARLWHPGDVPDLKTVAGDPCAAEPAMEKAVLWVRLEGREGYEILAKRALTSPKPREWVSSFRPPSAEVRRERPSREARLAFDFPGRLGEGLVRVMVEPIFLPDDAPVPNMAREVTLTGRVMSGDATVDSFRYRFEALPTAARRALPLAFERRLRPGRYRLEVELESPALGHAFVARRDLAVPGTGAMASAPAAAPVPAGAPADALPDFPERSPEISPEVSPEVRSLFVEADAALAAPHPGLRILSPGSQMLAGDQRFEVRVDRAEGLPDEEQIERVAFSLDGKPVLTRTRPPYVVQLDLGHAPRPHQLTVEGLNRRGEVLATDKLAVNAGGQRFAVRLLEPRPGRIYRTSLRAQVQVEAPQDRVERVELYVGDSRVATLYQPPYAQPLALPGEAQAGYVRAVAYLTDGTSAEDVVLLNTQAAAVEKMDVRLVELYTNVVDKAGRLIDGVGAGEIQVFEDGVRQPLRLVERVTETPLRLVTLIDNSSSMRPRLEATRQAALQFLRRTLRPGDQAAAITFNRKPRVAVGLTGDLAVLEDGLSGLVAEEQTSLYDSLIFSLDYLGGASGQRAVLLLSDGEDRTSAFRFEDALESARRAGIAVYAIGIGLPKGEASQRLARLAAETGGRSFFLKQTGELEKAYGDIEHDLRARYRISYQSSNTRPGDAFRVVQVKVARPGAEARTISGYYP
ncbi:MAG TPA: VWA domain-containing protein [Thermoanaerobaculia bacterium]|nr:VWA domain-containing protein [Thermoanaerobaculia bacterium]